MELLFIILDAFLIDRTCIPKISFTAFLFLPFYCCSGNHKPFFFQIKNIQDIEIQLIILSKEGELS